MFDMTRTGDDEVTVVMNEEHAICVLALIAEAMLRDMQSPLPSGKRRVCQHVANGVDAFVTADAEQHGWDVDAPVPYVLVMVPGERDARRRHPAGKGAPTTDPTDAVQATWAPEYRWDDVLKRWCCTRDCPFTTPFSRELVPHTNASHDG